MPHYSWTGIDQQGTQLNGNLNADTADQLRAKLLGENIALLSCNTQKQKQSFVAMLFQKKVSRSNLILFFDHLALLTSSGVDVDSALKTFGNQTTCKKLNVIIENLSYNIAKGQSLSNGLSTFPEVFSSFIINIVHIAEQTGNFSNIFENISTYLKTQQKLSQEIRNATTIPILTLIFSILIVIGIFTLVVPQFETIFQSMGKNLPRSTQIIIAISHALRTYVGLFLALSITFFAIVLKKIFQQKKLHLLKDKLSLRLPFLGKLFLQIDLIFFLQGLQIFTESGTPLKQALRHAQTMINNSFFRKKIVSLSNLIEQGKSFEYALRSIGAPYFPEKLIAMVAVGEQSGKLDQMLKKALHTFQVDLKNTLHFFTTLLHPLLLILVGIIIAGLMFTIYLPIFNLASLL